MTFRESGICRCCLGEGQFKTLTKEYRWISGQEIYGQMLMECFNLDVTSNENQEQLICEVCITRLRDATNFKKQVIDSGQHFQQQLQLLIKKDAQERSDVREFEVLLNEDEIFLSDLNIKVENKSSETNIAEDGDAHDVVADDSVADDAASGVDSSHAEAAKKIRKRLKTRKREPLIKSTKKDVRPFEFKDEEEETCSEMNVGEDDDASDAVSEADSSDAEVSKKKKKRKRSKTKESTSKPPKRRFTANINPELRQEIVCLFEMGESITSISRDTGVSRATVRRWVRRQAEEGNISDRPRAGRPRSIQKEATEKLISSVLANPYTATKEIARELNVSEATVRRTLHKAGIHRKPN